MQTKSEILIIDDEKVLAGTLAEFLQGEGYAVEVAHTPAEALAQLEVWSFAMILCDIQLPGMSGLDLLKKILAHRPETAVMMITAYATVESAVEAFRSGARDYLIKPVLFDDLLARLEHMQEWIMLRAENRDLRTRLARRRQSLSGLDSILGNSPAILAARNWIARIAPAGTNVLITGESGTGKELAARAIHELGGHADAPFLAINCAAIPADLLENQLFGHCRGAFTGADRDREGLLLAAGEGTVFLDEIGELPVALQAKLLRVIENREVLPVGAVRPSLMKARLLAATNKNLEEEVSHGRFRADLLYRLNVVNVKMPPLEVRREDIPELATALLMRQSQKLGRDLRGIEPDALIELQKRDWPGNVRELDNAMQRAAILAEGPYVTRDDISTTNGNLDFRPRNQEPAALTNSPNIIASELPTNDLRDAVRIYERAHISRVLADCGDDRKLAATRLGLGLSSLYAKIRELGISG